MLCHEPGQRRSLRGLRRRALRLAAPTLLGRGLAVLALCGASFAGPANVVSSVRAEGLVLRASLTPEDASGKAGAGAPVATAPRVVRFGGITRLAFDISAPVEASAFVLADPARVIVDLPETVFAGADEGSGKTVGLIASYRYGSLGAGKSRIVIDLAQPARVVRAGVETGADGALRLVVDLDRADKAAFEAAAIAARRSAVAPPAPSATAPAMADEAARTVVVIDPGHGGVDAGALGPERVQEKNIVFAFSQALARHLEADGRFSVIMTRKEDVFVSLSERVRIARAAKAQLFISIHADTLNEGGVSGATVYTVSDRASDAHAAKLAEKENLADKTAGFEGVEDAVEVSDILFDLTRRETRAYSHVFARTLVSIWKDAAKLNKNPQRSAGFLVLKAPDVPSVLFELGYLSSAKDAALLMAPEWREKTSAAVARAVVAFFSMRNPAGQVAAGVVATGKKGGVAAALP